VFETEEEEEEDSA